MTTIPVKLLVSRTDNKLPGQTYQLPAAEAHRVVAAGQGTYADPTDAKRAAAAQQAAEPAQAAADRAKHRQAQRATKRTRQKTARPQPEDAAAR